MEITISAAEKNYIIDGIQEGIRNDGRGTSDYREMSIETGVLATTSGSSRVRIADVTDILVSVKAELTITEDTSKCENRLRFYVDCSANATPLFAGRGGSDFGEDIAKALYNAYDNDYVLPDIKKFILAPTHMWTLFVDVVILQYGGNILDAASLGVKAALWDTEICEVLVRPADEGKVMVDLPEKTNTWRLDVSRVPIVICVNKLGDHGVIDATPHEEACSTSNVYVSVQPPECDYNPGADSVSDDDCIVTHIRKCKGGSLELESIDDLVNTAVRTARRLNKALLERLEEEERDRENTANKPFFSFMT
jgi:exosome complex component RRP42